MKQLLFIFLLCSSFTSKAQYTIEKLTNILTDGKTKSWSVKGTNIDLAEKVYTFNINGAIQIQKENPKPNTILSKWVLSTKDNIRWFIQIGDQLNELIISYDKAGKQYIKLTRQATDKKTSVYYESILQPLK